MRKSSSLLRRYRLSKWLDRFNKKLKKDRKKPEEVLTIIDSTPLPGNCKSCKGTGWIEDAGHVCCICDGSGNYQQEKDNEDTRKKH